MMVEGTSPIFFFFFEYRTAHEMNCSVDKFEREGRKKKTHHHSFLKVKRMECERGEKR